MCWQRGRQGWAGPQQQQQQEEGRQEQRQQSQGIWQAWGVLQGLLHSRQQQQQGQVTLHKLNQQAQRLLAGLQHQGHYQRQQQLQQLLQPSRLRSLLVEAVSMWPALRLAAWRPAACAQQQRKPTYS